MQLYESGEYRASKNWPYALSAGCVVYRSTESGVEVLLLKRESGHPNDPEATEVSYNLPKGHIDSNEPVEKAALRETQEEAGVECKLTTYLGAQQRDFTHPKFSVHNLKTTLFFAAKWIKDLETMDGEYDGRVWVSLDKAEKLLGPPNPKGEGELIRRLKAFLQLTTQT